MNDKPVISSKTDSSAASGWGFPLLARKAHYFVDSMSLCRSWWFIGRVDDSNHDSSDNCTTCKRLFSKVKLQAQDSANEKPEPVPAPTPSRELRLLCLLGKSKLGAPGPCYLPVHTMHRVPPRAMVTGKWSESRYAGLYLRETHAKRPSAEVLARILKHRQTDTFRANSRAVRAGVTA